MKLDRRLRRCHPAQRWGKRGGEGRFELCLGWRQIRDLSNLGAEGDGGEGRFCRAGIGAARYFNPKRGSANLYCHRPFWGGEGVGGWLGATRPSDTHDHPGRTMLRCLKAPAFVSMTYGPNRWLAHMSVTQRLLPLRHRSSVHLDTTLVCLVRLHLRMQTNLLSFANESVCITMPVFSLQ